MPTKTPFLLQAICILTLLVTSVSPSHALTKQPNLTYAERAGRPLKLDLYLPDTPPPASGYPLIISFHGGGWALGDKHRDLFLKPLVARGYALASVDYRLSEEAKFPAQIEDARASIHWLLRHAQTLHLDPSRIAVTGISAGGRLALLVAFSERHTFVKGGSKPLPHGTIKAVCAFYPPTDLIKIVPPEKRNDCGNLVALLLGAPVSQCLALAREASPISYIQPFDPPVFLVHGDKDLIVPLSQSQALAQARAKAGVETHLVIYAGQGHAFRPKPETVNEIVKFLDHRLD